MKTLKITLLTGIPPYEITSEFSDAELSLAIRLIADRISDRNIVEKTIEQLQYALVREDELADSYYFNDTENNYCLITENNTDEIIG